jgi:hypothetical protein
MEESPRTRVSHIFGNAVGTFADTEKNRKDSKRQSGKNRHKHIIAGKFAAKHTLKELSAVFTEYLIEALRPTETLDPRLLEGFGLFVVNYRAGAVTDLFALNRHIDRKFDILGQKMVLPAVITLDYLTAYTEAGTRDSAGRTEAHSRVIKIFRFTEEPKRITRGNPVSTVVFGVTVARKSDISAIEINVHFLDEVFVNEVIGIEDDICITIVALRQKLLKEEIESISFTDKFLIITFNDRGTVLSSDIGGIIGTVIGNKEYLDKLLGIILAVNTFEKITDNVFLVTGADYDTEFILFFGLNRHRAVFSEENPEYIQKLIQITENENRSKYDITYRKYQLYIKRHF